MDDYEAYLNLDLSKYIGKWVAIDKGKVIAADKDPSIVLNKARSSNPSKRPFIAKVPRPGLRIL
ncbi:succinyl-CoA synthetase subunit alpha [Candidatus Woesearchaeota archaeon]|nr:succinyl-CoA synthetase subunit alpha [Candidatus Woesearchaeota archaeon]